MTGQVRLWLSGERPINVPSHKGEIGDFRSLSFFLIALSGFPIRAVFSFANFWFLNRCSGVCAYKQRISKNLADVARGSRFLTILNSTWKVFRPGCGINICGLYPEDLGIQVVGLIYVRVKGDVYMCR